MNLHRLLDKIEFVFAKKYKLEKEHREIGMTYWDRPRKFDFDIVYSLPWVIYPQLVRFRRCEKNGVPMLHEMEDYTVGYSNEEHAQILEEWNEILDKMIFAFAEIIHDDAMFEEDYGAATDIKIQEGLDLFAKHFRNLWD